MSPDVGITSVPPHTSSSVTSHKQSVSRHGHLATTAKHFSNHWNLQTELAIDTVPLNTKTSRSMLGFQPNLAICETSHAIRSFACGFDLFSGINAISSSPGRLVICSQIIHGYAHGFPDDCDGNSAIVTYNECGDVGDLLHDRWPPWNRRVFCWTTQILNQTFLILYNKIT